MAFATSRGNIYLSHEGTYTDWMKNIIKDDHVEFKIVDIQFNGVAWIVKDEEALDRKIP